MVLWIAPLLLGPDAEVFATLGRFAPHAAERLACHILDPRHREVREHLAATCARLVVDYAWTGSRSTSWIGPWSTAARRPSGDIDDVGEAMQALLALIRERLAEAGHGDAAVEFRQPYVSPAIGAYGQILRASDCPADAVANRRKTIDARLLAVGQVVHGDMLMWGPSGGAGGGGPAALRLLVRGAADLDASWRRWPTSRPRRWPGCWRSGRSWPPSSSTAR